MAIIGERRKKTVASGYETDPLFTYASEVSNLMGNIKLEAVIDPFKDARDIVMNEAANASMKNFFVENSYDPSGMTEREIEDHIMTMEAQYENDCEAIMEHVGTAEMNPVVGMTFPLHKNILMNMVFDKGAIQKVVAVQPKFTLTMETRILVDTEGNEIDMFTEQHLMTDAIDKTAAVKEFDVTLPLTDEQEIVHTYLGGLAGADELSIETKVCAVLVKDVYYEVGDILPDETTGYVEIDGTGEVATEAGAHDTWYRVDMRFVPGYQGFERTFMHPVKIAHKALVDGAVKEVETSDIISGSMEKNRLNIIALRGKITDVRVSSKLDTSNARQTTCSVKWKAKSDIVEIPEAIPLNTTINPESVKDISAMYNVNQVTKVMSLFKTALGNYKDDKIYRFLNDSFKRLPERSRNYSTYNFAPRAGYHGDHIEWRRNTFMEHLDRHVLKLTYALNDPNMVVTIFGNPDIINRITPVEYSYQTPGQIGPMELDYQKTVVTSHKRVYQFISSDKMRHTDELLIILCPRGTERITYRIYDYQMYISNEIRNANNPALPAIHTFERWKAVEYQPVQGRIQIINPSGLTEDYDAVPVRTKA